MSDEPRRVALSQGLAEALVFFSSGAVLVLEILSLRLVAPYVGLTLETSTAIIGFALAAISMGAWVGGRVADHRPPQRALGPLLLAAGVLVLFVGPLVRWTGEQVRGGDVVAVMLMAAVAVFVPAALLSAVTPMVVKLRLSALAETGSVAGRLSGIATMGALVATFLTGFFLVAALRTSVILLVLGATLVVVGAYLTVRLRGLVAVAAPLAIALAGAGAALAAPDPCDVETAYHCARVVTDAQRPTGRTLELDTLSHSFVDLADPTYLRFSYIRAMASVIDTTHPDAGLAALHLGGGGLTLPRYLTATREDSSNLVFEIDEGIVELDIEQLDLETGGEIDVRVQDARTGLAQQRSDTRSVVVGDAFGGLAVPWHLTTRETVADIQRVLMPDGVYVVNVIDYPSLLFARAELATISDVFRHVAAIARPGVLQKVDGGNLVLVASDHPLPLDAIDQELSSRAPELDLLGDPEEVAAFIDGAPLLTDDYAPVDQLITPYPQR